MESPLPRQPYHNGPASDHFDGTRFFNPGAAYPRTFRHFLQWQRTRKAAAWPKARPLTSQDRPPQRVMGSELRVSFIGHISVLVQTRRLNILLDPHFSRAAGPFGRIGPERVHAPGIAFEDLPPIDVVVVSHNHYDHLDLPTIKQLWRAHRPRIVTPLGNDRLIHRPWRRIPVDVMDWGGTLELSEDITLHCLPCMHWSARGFRDRNMALWAAFGIGAPDGAVYFGGDSGYGGGDHFRAAREALGDIRLAILPIGAYEPRWFMEYAHMNPDEAVRAHKDLGAAFSLGSHFGTFRLTDEGIDEPLDELAVARQAHQVSEDIFRAIPAGTAWDVPGIG